MSKIADSVIKLPCSSVGDFIKIWLTFLTPLHKLTPTIINLAAEIHRQRFELSSAINDEAILDYFLMTNKDITSSIMANCNLSSSNYHVGITKLRKVGFFKDGKINPKFIPKITHESTSYSLMLLFSIPAKEDETREGV